MRKTRARSGRFLAEGVRVVEDLVASDLIVRWVAMSSTLVDTERGGRLADEIDRRGITRRTIDDAELRAFAPTETSQGLIAVADVREGAIEKFDLGGRSSVVLVLDAVQDPGNFGTMVRSAEAFGAAGIVALPGTVDPWNPKAVRAAAGSSFRVPIAVTDWPTARGELTARGVRLLGAAVEGNSILPTGDRPVALVVGNEGAGLSPGIRDEVDELIAVPMRGRAESLNVSAAAAILLYELSGSHLRRR